MPTLNDLFPQAGTPSPVRRPISLDWDLLNGVLNSLRREVAEPATRQSAVLDLLIGLLQAKYAAWVSCDADGRDQFSPELISPDSEKAEVHAAAAEEAKKARDAGAASFTIWKQSLTLVASQPVDLCGPQVLVVIVPTALNPAMVSAVLQAVVFTLFANSDHKKEPDKQKDSTSTIAAGLEVVVRLTDATDRDAAAKMICSMVQTHLKVEHVAVGLVKRSAMTVEPTAVSDVAKLDRKTAAAQLLADCLTESLPQAPLVTWSKADEANPIGLGHWRQLADSWQVAEMSAVRVTERSGETVAVCLIGSAKPLDEDGKSFLFLVSHLAGPLLRVLERATHGRRIQEWKDRLPTWLKGRRAVILSAALALPFVYPWSSRTACPVVLEPIAHRIVAAPFEGVFDRSLVKPGDRVEVGRVLGRMDGRELRTRLAACEADLARAGKSRDVNLAGGKLGGAQIDRLEMERLDHECAVIRRRLEQLEIRSPIAGVVVTGDLLSYESATLKVGQTLYEIAPLNRLRAELAVPEEDLEQVHDGAPVTIWLDAVGGRNWEATVERIRPRGELRDNLQVFVAETELNNVDDNLRPGMKGSATVFGPRAPGLWLLLRKPWYTALRFLGW